jgi:hypothetical protein
MKQLNEPSMDKGYFHAETNRQISSSAFAVRRPDSGR